MSEENVELLRRAVKAFNDRDLDWFDDSITDDGFDDVRDAFLTWFEAFEQVDFRFDEPSILESGDDVVTSLRMKGRGREPHPALTGRGGAVGRDSPAPPRDRLPGPACGR